MKVTILDSKHNIKLYDWSDVVTEDHNRQIVEETNRLISAGHYIQEDHPRYHISGDPFEDQPAEIWQVMKKTFHESCREYIGQPYTILSTQSRVTRMVYDKEIDYTEMWHDHVADNRLEGRSLSAIWFVNIPEELRKTGRSGTEFALNWPSTDETVFLGPYNLSWIMFPNTLMHRPGDLHPTLERFVMSADLQYSVP